MISHPGWLIYSFIHQVLLASCFGARHRGCSPARSPRALPPWKCQWACQTSPVKCVADVNLGNNYTNGSVRIVEKRHCIHFGLDTLFGTFNNRKTTFWMQQLTDPLLTPEATGCSLPAFQRPAMDLPAGHGHRGTQLRGEGRLQPVPHCHPPGAWSSPRCWHHLLDSGVTGAGLLCPTAS